jgi:hypothetical protein
LKSLNEIIAELEAFATAHWQIHTFGHGDVWEISPQSDGIVYPILWMVPQTATPTLNEVVDEFTILCMDLVDSGERNETDVLSDTRQIILDVCTYYRQTHTNAYIIEFGGSIQPFTERDPERVSGHSLTVRIKQPHDYNLCAVPANAVPVPSIPSCADATVQNAASNPTYQASVASGGVLVLPQLKVLDTDGVTPILANYLPNTSGFAATCSPATCEDVDITVNSTPFGTSPSGVPFNVPVVNGGDNPVGSEQSGEWVIGNSTVTINGTQVGDVVAEDSLPLAVELDGNPSGVWNAGTQTWEVTSTPSAGWVRPSDWIAIPDLTSADERGYFLVVVFENAYNQLGVRITAGAANINWGDGTNIVSTGSTQSKVYDYATLAGAVSVWPDGRNYKQVLVDITRVGGAIATVDFNSPTTIQPRGNNNVVDCVFSFPSLTDLRLSAENNANRRGMNLLQRLRVRNTGAVTVLQLGSLVSLQALEWADFEGTIPTSLLTSVQVIELAALNISAAGTAANSMFISSRTRKVGNITANAVTNAASMFALSRVLEQVGTVNFAVATTLQSCFSGCSALTKVGLITAPLNQTLQSVANDCYSLEELIFSDCAAVTNTTSMVANCPSLVNLVTPNLTRGVNVSDTSLGLTGMSNFANSLGVASGAQTVTVTSTPFGALLTALDPTAVAIAAVMTGKGYTIAN